MHPWEYISVQLLKSLSIKQDLYLFAAAFIANGISLELQQTKLHAMCSGLWCVCCTAILYQLMR